MKKLSINQNYCLYRGKIYAQRFIKNFGIMWKIHNKEIIEKMESAKGTM